MIINIVHIWVKPAHIPSFIEATMANHEGSIQEAGILRFDFLQEANDTAKFTLYEVFRDEDAVLAHKETPHYQLWRSRVEDWMDRPRQGVRHTVLAPTSSALW